MRFRTKLFLFGALTTAVVLIVLTIVQMKIGQRYIIAAAEERVARHIDMAWQMLQTRQRALELMTDLCIENPVRMAYQRKRLGVDLVSKVDTRNPVAGTIAGAILNRFPPEGQTSRTGIVALSPSDLAGEDKRLAQKTHIQGNPTAALALFSVRKISGDNAVVAAQILTRADKLLRQVQQGLFGDARYEGRRIGTVTVFTGPMRTSTTVEKAHRTSAVGTLVSDAVAKQVLEKGKSWTGRAFVVDEWYMSRYDPLRDPSGKVVGMLYIGELEALLLRQKHQIVFVGVASVVAVLLLALLGLVVIFRIEHRAKDQKSKMRFEFLRVLGHELKAPINAVDGYLQILSQQTLGPLPEKYLPLVTRSVLRMEFMRKLIADMLDLTRIEAGEKRREIVEGLDAAAVLREGVENVQPDADKRGIVIHVDAKEHIPVKADRGELLIICNNLLTNAVKYNRDNGEVEASLSYANGVLRLQVHDTGIGMTEAEQAKLFGEFVRIKNSKTRDILGSGLGLHIMKKIVSLYNGAVHVQSEENKGSTFTVTLNNV